MRMQSIVSVYTERTRRQRPLEIAVVQAVLKARMYSTPWRLSRLRIGLSAWGSGRLTGVAVRAGHYVSFIKSSERWLLLDDELVETVQESHVQQAFGTTQEYASNAEHGYILLYERRDASSA